MKTLALLLAVSSLSVSSGLAQTNQLEVQQSTPAISEAPAITSDKVARYIRFQTDVVNRVFSINVSYGGVVPMLYRADNPFQLINPFAPARYGNGFDNLSVNPISGRAEGIHVFAIRF